MDVQKHSAPVNSMNEGSGMAMVVRHLQLPKQEAYCIVRNKGRLNERVICPFRAANIITLRTNARPYIRRHEMAGTLSEANLG